MKEWYTCMGSNVTVYFLILVCSAWFAAAHTSGAVMDRWEVTKVSTQVHPKPFDQGTMHGNSIGSLTICSIETSGF